MLSSMLENKNNQFFSAISTDFMNPPDQIEHFAEIDCSGDEDDLSACLYEEITDPEYLEYSQAGGIECRGSIHLTNYSGTTKQKQRNLL